MRRDVSRHTRDARNSRSERQVRKSGSALIVAAALAASVTPALAQWRQWDADFDEDRIPWKEVEARIPSYPGAGDLIPFEAGAASPHRFYVDARSLSVGEDGVVR
ncbi:MAG: CNP1-like family protein, partial [Burkholderiales bacterium]